MKGEELRMGRSGEGKTRERRRVGEQGEKENV